MLPHCRSAQLTKQVLLQDAMRLSGSTYTVGGKRLPWAVVGVRPFAGADAAIGPHAAKDRPRPRSKTNAAWPENVPLSFSK